MDVCGKPVRFLGKMTSGHFTRCTRISGHAGECEDGDADEEKKVRATTETKTVIAPNANWPFKGKPPEGIGKPGADLPHEPTFEEIPDGVVIQ